MPRRCARGAALVLATVVTLAAVSAGASATSGDGNGRQVIALVNATRSTNGLGVLAESPDLDDAASAHAADMAAQNRLFHTPDLAHAVGGWTVLAENVGVGASIDVVHDAFLQSPEHRSNILDGRVTQMGAGVVIDGHGTWIVQLFRQPSGAPAPAAAPAPATGTPPEGASPAPAVAAASAPARDTSRRAPHPAAAPAAPAVQAAAAPVEPAPPEPAPAETTPEIATPPAVPAPAFEPIRAAVAAAPISIAPAAPAGRRDRGRTRALAVLATVLWCAVATSAAGTAVPELRRRQRAPRLPAPSRAGS